MDDSSSTDSESDFEEDEDCRNNIWQYDVISKGDDDVSKR